ncbi:MAG TPA: epoxyalkane--coenzyme M transferase, partial [Microbacteriaceae bacterium]|nr:epoxyalkane--coenzyme M transferase [Microbacteriaceae bacterium]
MQASTDRIQVSHAGSLPRTPELVAANAAREFEEDGFTLKRSPEYDALLQDAVTGLVQHQLDVGITAVGDGEFGKASSNPTDYGAWWVYSFQRVTGLSLTEVDAFNEPPHRS